MATGIGSSLTLGDASHTATNSGQITARDKGTVSFGVGLTEKKLNAGLRERQHDDQRGLRQRRGG
jgi:hypothetical protein